MIIKITFKRYQAGGSRYYIYADGVYSGIVAKGLDGRWNVQATHGQPSESIYRTRREAVESIMPILNVEKLAREHWANATSDDRGISAGDSPIYLASKSALLQGISTVYPDMVAQNVYYEWTEHGETILQTVVAMRRDHEEAERYAAEMAAEDAQWAAWTERHNLKPATQGAFDAAIAADHAEALTMNAQTLVREIQLTVRPEAGKVAVIMLAAYPDVAADKVAGHLPNGLPFTTVRVVYDDPQAAWRMVDVIKCAGEEWPNLIVKVRGQMFSASYPSLVRWTHGTHLTAPNYRAHDFPSLDAAVGASYAHR